ncbi:MAG: flagellar protein FliT [Gammaproteobacteria bacterium]|nr:flagellar protein FliT [Gammaproteobacteria bacterium]
MFFENHQLDFFRPLTSKYRAQILECLQLLYLRLYTSQADYAQLLSRDMVIECFEEAITRAPLLESQLADEFSQANKTQREQANWTLSLLLEHGWLEKQVDEATLQSSYGFTRVGRLFTQPAIELDQGRFRSRHRNTRNTRNALKVFVEQGDVYDLLDAFEYSERIISDFTDVIGELEQRKRSLIQEVEAQQLVQKASDEFFDFMETRFLPDLAIRLSVDSVEKYRDEIETTIKRVKRKKRDFKARAEKELRKTAPELLHPSQESLLYHILDSIEYRIHNASDIMLPALRKALLNFTRRADIIMRQLSFSYQGGGDDLLDNLRQLSSFNHVQFDRSMNAVSEHLAELSVGFIDPVQLKIRTARVKKVVDSSIEADTEMDEASRRELYLQQVLEKAFSVNNQQMRNYLIDAIARGHRISSHQLPVSDARQLIMRSHVIEVGSAAHQSSEFEFRVEANEQGRRVSDEHFVECDEFTLELVRKNHAL